MERVRGRPGVAHPGCAVRQTDPTATPEQKRRRMLRIEVDDEAVEQFRNALRLVLAYGREAARPGVVHL
ncbi:hypothetical protein Psi01_09730 [Planobispora siamensis]|uniref:Uncharacterized protein n=1 Tax=Planobispora siamensis TaxID=936338 RepID=A0A8J3SIN4_9ACTN|nr:hypothetical protein Psi01_09730 [Planobispora siamensis]